MGWSVGNDTEHRRYIGYGVPAICDHPGCGEGIDRGLSFACGGGVIGEDNCGLFFCDEHLSYVYDKEGEDNPDFPWAMCERCPDEDAPSFEPTPDTLEWASHVLTDESWAQWRTEEPEWAEDMKKIVENANE